ncbi:MAG: ATP-binding protein [Bacteroidota bacterium]|nr:ATP-binding protein [Bacteroidota bacterium]
MIVRQITALLDKLGKSFPVLAITGPRQIGKTTLARQFGEKANKETVYLDLESPRDFEKLSTAPELFLEQLQGKLVIIDEIQRMKSLFPLIRHLVDIKNKPLQFLLLGSASPDMIRDSSETLAGRIAFIELGGITLSEAKNKLEQRWYRGGFPIPFLTSDDEIRQAWFENFLFTYVQRDLPALGSAAPPLVMQRLIRMLAHLNGQLLNLSTLSRSLGLSVNTIKSYIDYLENGYMVRRVEPWSSNLGKRIVKTPKIYLRDSGLLHHLLNINTESALLSHPAVGASFESFALDQIFLATGKKAELFFYREHAGGEVDLLITLGNKIIAAVEIKLSSESGLSAAGKKTLEALKVKNQFIVTADSTVTTRLSGNMVLCSLKDFIAIELPAILK